MSYEERFYREQHNSTDLISYEVIIEESDLMVASTTNISDQLKQYLKEYRKTLEKACREIRLFKESLVPLNITSTDPMIQQMLTASQLAQVGPMAAVAGTVSEFIGKKAIASNDTKEIIVENGGDIYMDSQSDRRIMIYAGDSKLSNKIGLVIRKEMMPLGICTSSGTLGHSLSFGKADAVVVLSKNTSLADAVATSVGNLILTSKDIEKGISFAKDIEGILGILVIVDNQLGVWGQIELFRP